MDHKVTDASLQRFMVEREAFAAAQRRRRLTRWAIFGALVIPAGLFALWIGLFVSVALASLIGLIILGVGAKLHPEL